MQNSGTTGPYTLEINGETYNGIESGVPFLPNIPGQSTENIWSIVPSPPSVSDGGNPVVLGVKFRSSQEGYISGIRFFKSWTDGGTENFEATLYTNGDQANPGSVLASGQATYSDSDAGWLNISFTSPVLIEANTTYIASYRTPNARYSASGGYFTTSYNEPGTPLTALSSSDSDGPNGVYVYDYQAGFPFPSYTYNSANYWVDVNFTEAVLPEGITSFTLTNIVPADGCASSGLDLGTTTIAINPSPDGTLSSVSGMVCSEADAEITFESSAGTGPFDLVINGDTYTEVDDGGTISIPTNFADFSLWDDATIPAGPTNVNDGQSIEIGVKFRASNDGLIRGIRFYKGAGNSGTHVGNLWSNTGSLLASATFTDETTSGWQEVIFDTPVSIVANTTYIASYFSPLGFAIDAGFFNQNSVIAGPLTALASGTDGPNGVYKYGGGFPDGGNDANYWVDVVYSPSGQTFDLSSITDANGCISEGDPISSLTLPFNFTQTTWYVDTDGDGFGDPNVSQVSCAQPLDYVLDNNDCDDTRDYVYPGAPELCDGLDNDCDGTTDFGSDPAITITDAQGNEGGDLTFTVTLSYPVFNGLTIAYSTVAGTADISDYSEIINGLLTFNSCETSQTILIQTTEDQTFESNEVFTVVLSNPSIGTINDDTAEGTIIDNDTAAQISINDAQAVEGQPLSFEITLSSPSGTPVTITYTAQTGTAGSADYTEVTNSVTFAAGETSKMVTVESTEDSIFEGTENFTVELSDASGGVIADGTGVGTIIDNDTAPEISISDAQAVEGQPLSFEITLSNPSSTPVTVTYTTQTGTAGSADYTEVTNSVTFAAGETSKTITVDSSDDIIFEGNENFTVELSDASGGVIADGTGIGTIIDNDNAPEVSISDAQAVEGQPLSFEITLSNPSSTPLTVTYTTQTGTAGSADYTEVTNSVTFAAGETSKTITVDSSKISSSRATKTLPLNYPMLPVA